MTLQRHFIIFYTLESDFNTEKNSRASKTHFLVTYLLLMLLEKGAGFLQIDVLLSAAAPPSPPRSHLTIPQL